MRIIICGAGEVGTQAAEVLADRGDAITVIDTSAERLRKIADTMDVSTLEGNCAGAGVLREAGIAAADLLVATTNVDEINIMAASLGRAMGVRRTVARVHRSDYLDERYLNYREHFGIDHLICPEFSAAASIARSLRNPAALAIEHFAEGRIEMHEFSVSTGARAIGRPLAEVSMPKGSRIAAVSREKEDFLPVATTVLEAGDRVLLVADSDVFEDARRLFRPEAPKRRKVILAGGTPMAEWLSTALRARAWSIRLFETDRERAQALAERLDWVTVLNADPTDKSVFADEQIALADVFIGLLDDEEDNIVGAVLAKAGGVLESIAVVHRSKYLDLLYHIGVDRAVSPGMIAAEEIRNVLDESPFREIAKLARNLFAYQVRIESAGTMAGPPLAQVGMPEGSMITAIKRGDKVWVPGASDAIKVGDTVLVIARRDAGNELRRGLAGS